MADVSQLPPELLRKGRRDELFFVDLPTREEREAIWQIQIAKFHRDAPTFDLRQLARATDSFTRSNQTSHFRDAIAGTVAEAEHYSSSTSIVWEMIGQSALAKYSS